MGNTTQSPKDKSTSVTRPILHAWKLDSDGKIGEKIDQNALKSVQFSNARSKPNIKFELNTIESAVTVYFSYLKLNPMSVNADWKRKLIIVKTQDYLLTFGFGSDQDRDKIIKLMDTQKPEIPGFRKKEKYAGNNEHVIVGGYDVDEDPAFKEDAVATADHQDNASASNIVGERKFPSTSLPTDSLDRAATFDSKRYYSVWVGDDGNDHGFHQMAPIQEAGSGDWSWSGSDEHVGVTIDSNSSTGHVRRLAEADGISMSFLFMGLVPVLLLAWLLFQRYCQTRKPVRIYGHKRPSQFDDLELEDVPAMDMV